MIPARRALAHVLLAAIGLCACGGASSKRFSSSRVPFSFDYPSALKSCGAFGGATVVLGWCSSEPIFGITSTDYVAVGPYGGAPVTLARLRSDLKRLVPNAWSSVATERHSGIPMVVTRAQRKPGYPRSAYFFEIAAAIWRIDCASSPTHLRDSEAACRQAVGSVNPTAG